MQIRTDEETTLNSPVSMCLSVRHCGKDFENPNTLGVDISLGKQSYVLRCIYQVNFSVFLLKKQLTKNVA